MSIGLSQGKAMAGLREFDEKAVLDAAVHRFWLNGYDGTSVRELAQSMGVTRASLYNAFGDKRMLFQRALAHYLANSFADRVSRFESLGPRDAIVAFFNEIVDRSMSDNERKGCLLVNATLEIAPHDPEFQETIAGDLVQVEGFFRCCVAAGQTSGQISRGQSVDDLAGILLGTLLGIRVLGRTRPERMLLEGLLRPVYALLS